MNLSNILKTSDNTVGRIVDRLSLDPSQKTYLDTIDAYINLSRTIFCRRKTVDRHIEYLQEKNTENMRDTHYVIQPRQIENVLENISKSLQKDIF